MLPPASNLSWNPAAAAHLLGRAGFGATPSEIEAAHRRGREQTIADFLAPPPPAPNPELTAGPKLAKERLRLRTMDNEERQKMVRDLLRQNAEELSEVRSWWMGQMIRPASATQEKAVLFWHGHFATSWKKVKSTDMMWQQNQLFRQFAFGNFRDLVKAISCDPAMVIWLDLQQSRNGAPNENFARELMELFTLGIGHYTEDDIKNSARAFTGYRTRQLVGDFDFNERQHDSGEKVFMGKKGRFNGDDIIDILFEQPACAEFICRKLWTFYAYEDPEPDLISSLAHTFRQSSFELRPVFREMFGSSAFYSKKAVATQIKSPAQLIAQTCRTLECPSPSAAALRPIFRGLGQMLFDPPNVKGWDGNRAWINTATLAHRHLFTDALAGIGHTARLLRLEVPLEKIVTDAMINQASLLVDGLAERLLAVPLDQATRAELIAGAGSYETPMSRDAVREMLAKIMRLPEFQLV